ncbi:hypothetical protein [Parapedobacter soli]|uniref:hypothetical protein n=1 Tax=Parapedobacter soli TaxID=416955 RepID=UPI0021C57FBC|nr:hypothetical protein [Parapedobacter soli]
MEVLTAQSVAIAATFIWIGLILGISFLEAWLKFRAPGVTTAIGLGIGRLVFGALNKLEWVLAIIVAIGSFIGKGLAGVTGNVVLLIIVAILILQTVWMLPVLDKRARRVINNEPVRPSSLHIFFITAELVKVGLLFTIGKSLLSGL